MGQQKEQRTVTRTELAEILQPITGSTFVSVVYTTDVAQARTVQGKKVVQKTTEVRAALNHAYTQKVQRLSENAEFQAAELKGKTRVSSTLIRSDKSGELMIDLKVLNPKSDVKTVAFWHDGAPISEAEAVEKNLFAPAYFAETPRTTAGRGTVSEEDNFLMLTPRLSAIESITLNGVTYKVTPDEPATEQ
jgi:hypothetical protein